MSLVSKADDKATNLRRVVVLIAEYDSLAVFIIKNGKQTHELAVKFNNINTTETCVHLGSSARQPLNPRVIKQG